LLGGLPLVVVTALVLAVPPALPPYLLNIATLALIVAVAAVGLDLLMGYTGLESLGQAAF
jgi:branched-chain amino acid transport system permease protein